MAVKRVNEGVLGPLERPTLAWIAQRLPPWIVSDHLTTLGVAGALLAAAGYVLSIWWLPWLWLSCVGLITNWFGDSLDGTLARLRCRERPRYGFFVDHTCDMFSQVIVFLAIGVSPCAHFGTSCIGLIAFLMAFIYTMIGTHVRQRMRITYFGFGPTEMRLLLILGNALILLFGVIDLRPWLPWLGVRTWFTLHDLVICLIASAGVVLIVFLAIREARALGSEDPAPVGSK